MGEHHTCWVYIRSVPLPYIPNTLKSINPKALLLGLPVEGEKFYLRAELLQRNQPGVPRRRVPCCLGVQGLGRMQYPSSGRRV